MLDYEFDIRSDMSRFHGVLNLEDIDATTFVAFAIRLAAYDGVLAHAVRREMEKEQQKDDSHGEQALSDAVAFDGTAAAMEANEFFNGLGSFSTVSASELTS